MHRFSFVNGISDNPDECHFFAGKLCDESNEDGLSGRQLEMRSAENARTVNPSAAEVVPELQDEEKFRLMPHL